MSVADSLLTAPDTESNDADGATRLIMHLLAAFDLPSVLLHCTRLSDAMNLEGLRLAGESVETIREIARSPNGFVDIGVELAGRLGHRRLTPSTIT